MRPLCNVLFGLQLTPAEGAKDDRLIEPTRAVLCLRVTNRQIENVVLLDVEEGLWR